MNLLDYFHYDKRYKLPIRFENYPILLSFRNDSNYLSSKKINKFLNKKVCEFKARITRLLLCKILINLEAKGYDLNKKI